MLNRLGMIPVAVALAAGSGDDATGYRAEVERWRQQREQTLKADDGWLTLVGLQWLRPGETTLGSDPSSDVLLPPGAAATVGVLTLGSDGQARFKSESGVAVTVGGKPFAEGALKSDADVLTVGTIRVLLIKRGTRYALRIKDNASEARSAFSGLRWYPVDEAWKVKARFVPHAKPMTLAIDTIVGERESIESPGDVTFTIAGNDYRLRALKEGDHLWFVFRDKTAGRTTQGNARQLSAEMPGKDGVVTLDFNKATNLPCAYTSYATCPLPPKENRLGLEITAGEMKYEARPLVAVEGAGSR
jgi:uncharacterized protein (DUF1684 family)